jgi:hypothetical protein
MYLLKILWHVYLLLDNARNTHAAYSMGTMFSLSVAGLLLCNSRAVMSSRDVSYAMRRNDVTDTWMTQQYC